MYEVGKSRTFSFGNPIYWQMGEIIDSGKVAKVTVSDALPIIAVAGILVLNIGYQFKQADIDPYWKIVFNDAN